MLRRVDEGLYGFPNKPFLLLANRSIHAMMASYF